MAEPVTNEELATDVCKRHGLSSLNLWREHIDGLHWIARAFRADPKGFQASCETGGGMSIREALTSLDERLAAGPIAKRHIPILDAEPKQLGS